MQLTLKRKRERERWRGRKREVEQPAAVVAIFSCLRSSACILGRSTATQATFYEGAHLPTAASETTAAAATTAITTAIIISIAKS